MKNFDILYKNEIVPAFIKKFDYKNSHLVPKILKICVNCCHGLKMQNKTFLEKAVENIRIITGQHPIIVKSKQSVSEFKLRKGLPISLLVTLRKKKMYHFLQKLVLLVIPKIRNFNGLSKKNFDSRFNYNLGFSDQKIFPELQDQNFEERKGININIIIKSSSIQESIFLLENFKIPFIK